MKSLKPDSPRKFYLSCQRLKISRWNRIKTTFRYLSKLHIQNKIHSLFGISACMETDTQNSPWAKGFFGKQPDSGGALYCDVIGAE